jgi:hypothetical protein
MKLSVRRALTAAPILIAASLLAACGGSTGSGSEQVASIASGDQSSTEAATTSTTSSTSFQDSLLKFARCMRGNGVDVPDPTFDSNGRPQFQQGGANGAFDPNDPKFRAAQEKCGSILQAALPTPSPGQQQQFRDAALKYARCMRQHGVDIPDPDFSNNGPGGGGFFGGQLGGRQNDPKFRVANEACRSAFEGLFPGGGPGGLAGGSTGSSQ